MVSGGRARKLAVPFSSLIVPAAGGAAPVVAAPANLPSPSPLYFCHIASRKIAPFQLLLALPDVSRKALIAPIH